MGVLEHILYIVGWRQGYTLDTSSSMRTTRPWAGIKPTACEATVPPCYPSTRQNAFQLARFLNGKTQISFIHPTSSADWCYFAILYLSGNAQMVHCWCQYWCWRSVSHVENINAQLEVWKILYLFQKSAYCVSRPLLGKVFTDYLAI